MRTFLYADDRRDGGGERRRRSEDGASVELDDASG